MSYILDALRKADADRTRDPARGIHAQAVGAPSPEPARRLWPWAVAALALAALASWLFMPRQDDSPVVATRSVAPAEPPPATTVMPPAAPRLAQAPTPAPARTPAPAPAAAPVAAAPLQPAQAASAPPSAKAVPPDRVVAVSELPADVQRDLPRVPLAGGVYSQNAAQRMLIVNGQVVGEGAEVAPGLVLEQIQPKAAVLRFRGWRYTVPY